MEEVGGEKKNLVKIPNREHSGFNLEKNLSLKKLNLFKLLVQEQLFSRTVICWMMLYLVSALHGYYTNYLHCESNFVPSQVGLGQRMDFPLELFVDRLHSV